MVNMSCVPHILRSLVILIAENIGKCSIGVLVAEWPSDVLEIANLLTLCMCSTKKIIKKLLMFFMVKIYANTVKNN